MRILSFALASVVSLSAAGSPIDVRIERMIDRMSPRERVAQLLRCRVHRHRVNDEIRLLVSNWRVGAIVLYSRNINTPEQLKTLTAGIRGLSHPGLPPLIAIDQEGGEVTRISDGVPDLPGQMALGATRSPDLARRAGRTLGTSLASLGITLKSRAGTRRRDPRSPIGIRAFSDDAALTPPWAPHSSAASAKVESLSTAKTLPGIGFAPADSHAETAAAFCLARRSCVAPILRRSARQSTPASKL